MTNELSAPTETKKRCFFISRIGADGSQERLLSDFVMSFVLAPVFDAEYTILRADRDPSPYITRSILKNLLKADIVVADITGGNPNVFYELAVRHCAGLPCILLLHKGERPPFDLSVIKYIAYDQQAASVANAHDELRKRLAWIAENSDEIDSEIGHIPGIQFLKLETLSE